MVGGGDGGGIGVVGGGGIRDGGAKPPAEAHELQPLLAAVGSLRAFHEAPLINSH